MKIFISKKGIKCNIKTTNPTSRLYKRGVSTTPSNPHITAEIPIAILPLSVLFFIISRKKVDLIRSTF